MPSIFDVTTLEGEVTIDREHFGDIHCKTLTVVGRGRIHGNVVCDLLQLGGRIDGIVICNLAEMNTVGLIVGSLYGQQLKSRGWVEGFCTRNDPPLPVWALVMPEMVPGADLPVFTADEAPEAEIDFALSAFEGVALEAAAIEDLATVEVEAPVVVLEKFAEFYPTPQAISDVLVLKVTDAKSHKTYDAPLPEPVKRSVPAAPERERRAVPPPAFQASHKTTLPGRFY